MKRREEGYETYVSEGAKPSVIECFWFCWTGSLGLHKVSVHGSYIILPTITLIVQLSAELLEDLTYLLTYLLHGAGSFLRS